MNAPRDPTDPTEVPTPLPRNAYIPSVFVVLRCCGF